MIDRNQLTGPFAMTVVAIIVAVVAIAVNATPVLSAIFRPGLSDEGPNMLVARLMEEHTGHMETYRERFDGRSFFFPPPAPPKPKTVRPTKPVVKTEEPEPPPPRAPARYTGPDIVAFLGESVWFSNETQIKIGEEADGVKVISVNPPWSARLAHKGGEYEVPLFGDEESFLSEGSEGTEIDGSTSGLVEAPPQTIADMGMSEPEADDGDVDGEESVDDESGDDESGDDESDAAEEDFEGDEDDE